jgi:hypothetical protein
MSIDPCMVSARYCNRRTPTKIAIKKRSLVIDEDLCFSIADWYEKAPIRSKDPKTLAAYRLFKEETAQQYEALLEAGLTIEPWLTEGQPYRSASNLHQKVSSSGLLYVYLTTSGQGHAGKDPNPIGYSEMRNLAPHPMTELTGLRFRNVDIMYNDLFRAVHDIFGHVMNRCSFSINGEFRATWHHLQMYSDEVHPVILSETIGQICWFFYGPHLRTPSGNLRQLEDPCFIPPNRRLYPIQKTSSMPNEWITKYLSQFQ